MQSNVVVVTEPDFYFANQPAILLIGCDLYIESITDNIRRMPLPITVYQTTEDNTLEWITNAYNSSDLTIMNCQFSDFFTGYFIDKHNVFYYNNRESYKRFNFNEAADPLDPLIKWINTWHIENQDKNAVLL